MSRLRSELASLSGGRNLFPNRETFHLPSGLTWLTEVEYPKDSWRLWRSEHDFRLTQVLDLEVSWKHHSLRDAILGLRKTDRLCHGTNNFRFRSRIWLAWLLRHPYRNWVGMGVIDHGRATRMQSKTTHIYPHRPLRKNKEKLCTLVVESPLSM